MYIDQYIYKYVKYVFNTLNMYQDIHIWGTTDYFLQAENTVIHAFGSKYTSSTFPRMWFLL